jgi:hypothetical protein
MYAVNISRGGRARALLSVRRWTALIAVAALALTGITVVTVAAGLASSQRAAATTPGSPGTPQAPASVYDETFENGVGTPITSGQTPELLSGYTGGAGAANETYTAGPFYAGGQACNGFVVAGQDAPSGTTVSGLGCGRVGPVGTGSGGFDQPLGNYAHLQAMAWAVGSFQGESSATAQGNHILAGYTDANPSGVNSSLEMQTQTPISVPSNHYYTFSVLAVAHSCNGLKGVTVAGAIDPKYQFSILNGGTATPVGGTIDSCQTPQMVYYEPWLTGTPAAGTTPIPVSGEPHEDNPYVAVGNYVANGAIFLTGSTLGVQLQDVSNTGAGNDAGIDNIQILDVTPQLDKAFNPTTITQGATSTLTYTITKADANHGLVHNVATATATTTGKPVQSPQAHADTPISSPHVLAVHQVLAQTGAAYLPWLVPGGLVMVLIGFGLTAITRRRRTN